MNHTLVTGVSSLDQNYDFASHVGGGTMLTLKRPGVDKFLGRMSEIFEVIAFTSCDKRLAEPILEELDKSGGIFAHRLYTESCGYDPCVGHVKELAMLGRGLERVMIVDDSRSKCVLNPDNWVPVSRFEGDLADQELLDLIPFVEKLAEVDDVRPALRERQKEWLDKEAKRLKV